MTDRITRFITAITDAKLDGFVLNPGPSLAYLTDLNFHLMERPTVALFTAKGKIGLVLPILEREKLKGLPFELDVFPFGDDPNTWNSAFQQALSAMDLQHSKIGVEPTRLRVLELRYLEAAAAGANFSDGSHVLTKLRMVKEPGEVEKMRQAAQIAQTALLETLKSVRIGLNEREIASELVVQLYRAGSDIELPFQPIVSSGPNSANPHASPSDRVLQEGDLLLFDWGASKDGYFSDITRTFTVGQVHPALVEIGEVVFAANAVARTNGQPGMASGEVDLAARNVIEKAGYGAYFTHRTGHGLGMEAHEAPYIFGENNLILREGMTFTIEPGIYLPGRGGVRIEDDVLVTANGLESLTDLPRHVLPLDLFWS